MKEGIFPSLLWEGFSKLNDRAKIVKKLDIIFEN
jgi:hypothetical protein